MTSTGPNERNSDPTHFAHAAVVVGTPWLRVAQLTIGPDAPGETPHARHERPESFFVLSGEIRLLLDGGEHELQAGSWVHLPAGVGHAIVPVGRARIVGFDAPGSREASAALVVPPGGGETISDRPGRRSTLLCETDQFAVTEFVYGPGEQGPDPHVHHGHADVFLVLAGALEIGLRDSMIHATPETLVVIPPDVIHAYASESAAVTRILNLHTPSSGFGDYLRGRNPHFDQHTPPDDGGADPATVVSTRLTPP